MRVRAEARPICSLARGQTPRFLRRFRLCGRVGSENRLFQQAQFLRPKATRPHRKPVQDPGIAKRQVGWLVTEALLQINLPPPASNCSFDSRGKWSFTSWRAGQFDDMAWGFPLRRLQGQLGSETVHFFPDVTQSQIRVAKGRVYRAGDVTGVLALVNQLVPFCRKLRQIIGQKYAAQCLGYLAVGTDARDDFLSDVATLVKADRLLRQTRFEGDGCLVHICA